MEDKYLSEFSSVLAAKAEQLRNEYDLDPHEARQRARKGIRKNESYFSEEELFDSYD